jgi:hypothetical protein
VVFRVVVVVGIVVVVVVVEAVASVVDEESMIVVVVVGGTLSTVTDVVGFEEPAGTKPTGMYPSSESNCSSQRMSTDETIVFW